MVTAEVCYADLPDFRRTRTSGRLQNASKKWIGKEIEDHFGFDRAIATKISITIATLMPGTTLPYRRAL